MLIGTKFGNLITKMNNGAKIKKIRGSKFSGLCFRVLGFGSSFSGLRSWVLIFGGLSFRNNREMKQNLFDEIREEKIRSKTTDQAIAETFRLDRLDQIAEQTKPKAKKGVRLQIPRINRDGGFDYAPEVDPYEDMDVEGLLNLEDYVVPEAEKQIAKMPKEAPKYEMDPRFWQLPAEPPPVCMKKKIL